MGRRETGLLGERLAALFLEKQGYELLASNIHVGRKELDLIMSRHGVCVFVEVRTVTKLGFIHPAETLTPKKLNHVKEAGMVWLSEQKRCFKSYRFDALTVILEPSTQSDPLLEHYENIIT